MNMTRCMVLRVSNKPNIAEAKRRHGIHNNPSDLGYQDLPSEIAAACDLLFWGRILREESRRAVAMSYRPATLKIPCNFTSKF
jgi:hypothetical protein